MDVSLATINQVAASLSPAQVTAIETKAKEFEALVLSQMLAPMFDTLEKSSLFGDGPGGQAYQSMMNDAFANAIADHGGVGISDQIKSALISLQSSSTNSSPSQDQSS